MRSANTLTVLAALASTTAALNINRHGNWAKPVEERAPKCTNWVTVVETATVYAKQSQPTPTPTPTPAADNNAAAKPTPEVESTPEVIPANGAYEESSRTGESSGSGSSSTPAPLSNKVGFAYNDANLVNELVKSGVKGSWAYNWNSRDDGLDADIDYVPMLWSDRADHLNRWDANIKEMLAKGAKHILSFNEPDIKSQANLTPDAAAKAHVKYVNPYGGNGVRIGAPAVSNSNLAGEGTDWLAEFIPKCRAAGCQIDFCVAHWYSPASDDEGFLKHLQTVRDICGEDTPVWLTEFAPVDGTPADEAAAFLKRNLKVLNDLEWVERYSYFMVGGAKGRLTQGDSTQLTTEGEAYFEG
ncbi:uncharacterized protein DNG_06109 [Cephalotrichum gorgonifer]|uniref:Asl1-like glycosyl hydrolase catalytic domain-containing protein n=1 Tax=Cephalotrichum gorgonifer TaxID=2041049 RepID=A0AAE8MZ14_9PEZI|nr:uncharacterized protein DNG_06109 [Cephalotrichum gorgonifer]